MTELTPPLSAEDHVDGPARAELELVMYGDFQCPYCTAAYPIVRRIRDRMAGRLLFAFRHSLSATSIRMPSGPPRRPRRPPPRAGSGRCTTGCTSRGRPLARGPDRLRGRARTRTRSGIAAELDRRARGTGAARRRQRRRQRGHRHAGVLRRRARVHGVVRRTVADRGPRGLGDGCVSSGSRPGRSPERPLPRRVPAGSHRAAPRAPHRLSGITVPSSRRCSPLTEIVLRRSRRTGVERRRCTAVRPKQPTVTRAPATTVFATRTRGCSPTTR